MASVNLTAQLQNLTPDEKGRVLEAAAKSILQEPVFDAKPRDYGAVMRVLGTIAKNAGLPEIEKETKTWAGDGAVVAMLSHALEYAYKTEHFHEQVQTFVVGTKDPDYPVDIATFEFHGFSIAVPFQLGIEKLTKDHLEKTITPAALEIAKQDYKRARDEFGKVKEVIVELELMKVALENPGSGTAALRAQLSIHDRMTTKADDLKWATYALFGLTKAYSGQLLPKGYAEPLGKQKDERMAAAAG